MNKPAVACLKKDMRATRLLWAAMAFSYFVFLLMFMNNVWVYLAMGDTATAITEYKKALEINPQNRRAARELEMISGGKKP